MQKIIVFTFEEVCKFLVQNLKEARDFKYSLECSDSKKLVFLNACEPLSMSDIDSCIQLLLVEQQENPDNFLISLEKEKKVFLCERKVEEEKILPSGLNLNQSISNFAEEYLGITQKGGNSKRAFNALAGFGGRSFINFFPNKTKLIDLLNTEKAQLKKLAGYGKSCDYFLMEKLKELGIPIEDYPISK